MGSASSKEPSLPPDLPCLKIALVGNPGVGKTSVMLRYLRNQFSQMYIPTKKVAIENVVRKLNVPAHTVVSLTFWDIPGREDMDLHKSYFRNLDAAIVIVDMTDPASIDMANVWKQTVLNKLTKTQLSEDKKEMKETPVDPINFPVLLLGNKYDIIEEEMYRNIASRKVSVSTAFPNDDELTHEAITQLENVADAHNFIGCVTVSARLQDSSVAMAIQSLVRSIFEKQGIPRKWKAVPPKPKPPKKDRPFHYDKLEKIDIEKVLNAYQYAKLETTEIEKYDLVIEKADSFVKKSVVLRHYYTVSLARFKHACQKIDSALGDNPSLEDCIVVMKQNVKGANVKMTDDEGFCKMEVIFIGEESKQSKQWKESYRIFHNEFAPVAKTIQKDGPDACIALEKQEIGMQRMLQDYVGSVDETKMSNNELNAAISGKIVRNTAKVQHARDEMQETINDVEDAARKIFSVEQW
ncbi:hypothetical protein ACF0H5_007663 [Mactra antiquata]